MTFTIEQLKELKNCTTPGPWLHTQPPYSEDNPPEIFAEDGSLILEIGPRTDHISRADEDLMFAASVPELLDQLIATETKLQKVLKSIEGLRTECVDVVLRSGSGHEEYTGNEVADRIADAHWEALTKILEENK